MSPRPLRWLRAAVASGLLATAALAVAPPARAEDPTPEALARAREEYRRGLALEQAGDWEGALVIFKGVALVKSTPQVRFHIAQCEEKVGNWVEALGSYRLALSEAQQSNVADVQKEAASAIEALEPRVPKLTIHRGTGAAAARVLLDGRELGPASVGTPIAVNPGPHRIEATSPGRETSVTEVVAEEGKASEVALTLKDQPGAAKPQAPPPVEDEGGSALVPVGVVALGVGVASLGVSGIFFAMRGSAISDLDAACGPDGQSCPADLEDTADSGATYATVSTVTFVAGLTCVALGATLLVVDLTSDPEGADAASAPRARAALGPGSVSVTGAF